VSTVYHLASSTVPSSSAADPAFDIETNVVATLPLLEACAARRIRIVFTSSGGTVYGVPETLPIPETHATWPVSTHGVGKLTVEKILFAFGCTRDLDYRILRLSNVYGEGQSPRPGMGAVATFLERILALRPIDIWGDGSQRRDFLYVEDAVRALVKIADIETPRWRLVNIGSGQATSIAELCELAFGVTGRRTEVRLLPARSFDVPANALDIRRAREMLGFDPATSLEQGIRRTWTWLLATGTGSERDS
jgi:UDP-glucose 4-epimerase